MRGSSDGIPIDVAVGGGTVDGSLMIFVPTM